MGSFELIPAHDNPPATSLRKRCTVHHTATGYGSSIYKYVIMGILFVICLILSIRIKGKIVALWIVTILRCKLTSEILLVQQKRHDASS